MASNAPRDDLDGDILTFSELDFARLELANKQSQNEFSPQLDNLTEGYPFPMQSNPFPVEQSFFTDDLNLDLSTNLQHNLHSEFWLDPALDLQQWQTPPSMQTDTSRDISPLATADERVSTPALTGPSFTNGFAGLPPLETQQQTLPRKRSTYFRSPATPISIPHTNLQRDRTQDPMQRWQDSPPEAEPASLSAIADALSKTTLRKRSSAGSLGKSRVGSRAGSIGSATSVSDVSVGSPARRRTGRVSKSKRGSAKSKITEKRRFPCTFCCDSFKSKYDWARHEKSLHLDLQGWRCTPFGGTVVSPDTGQSHCAYCNQLDPSAEHLETHNHASCQNDEKPHIFRRKDHLVQHLRLVHHIKTLPAIESWKVEGPPIKSRCGICSIRMETWQERVEHLAKHFRKGDTMEDWKGEHDFEPHVKARVTNALAPYMIAAEERAPVPFSATDPSSKDHLLQILKNVKDEAEVAKRVFEELPPQQTESTAKDVNSLSFPEFLAYHLGKYAQQQISVGIMPTDEMFQTEARRIVYDTHDPWDQTLADNKDWLSCFRNCHLGGSSGQ